MARLTRSGRHRDAVIENGSFDLGRLRFFSTPGARALVALALLCSLSGCSAAERELGRVNTTPPLPFGPPRLIEELAILPQDLQDPTLTGDERELFFTTPLENGLLQIWTATRPARSEPWADPHPVTFASASEDAMPEVSSDGLRLWFASDRSEPGSALNLWQTERPSRDADWASPVAVTSPAPGANDIAPSLDPDGLWLAYASLSSSANFDIYLAGRASADEPWGEAQALSVNSSDADWDPAIFARGTKLLFASRRIDEGDLFFSARSEPDGAFTPPSLVAELNSPSAEGDPWISADENRVYFFSDRSGVKRLYVAER